MTISIKLFNLYDNNNLLVTKIVFKRTIVGIFMTLNAFVNETTFLKLYFIKLN